MNVTDIKINILHFEIKIIHIVKMTPKIDATH